MTCENDACQVSSATAVESHQQKSVQCARGKSLIDRNVSIRPSLSLTDNTFLYVAILATYQVRQSNACLKLQTQHRVESLY